MNKSLIKPANVLVSSLTTRMPEIVAGQGKEVIQSLHNREQVLEAALRHFLPDSKEDTQIQKARRIMGEDVKKLTDEELETYLTEFNYLIKGWIDSYEKEIFNGITLQQLLREE